MRRVLHGIGTIFLLLAVLLCLLAVVSWPPEGLFFGLPFFFLMPALLLGIAGGLLWLCTRPSKTLPSTDVKGISKPSKKYFYTILI
jgi:hypothetical protein